MRSPKRSKPKPADCRSGKVSRPRIEQLRVQEDALFLKRMYRERAEHHGRDQREGAVQGRGMEAGSGSPGQRARMKMKAGFRR